MRIEDLHYGDVLRSRTRPEYLIMFLGRVPDDSWSSSDFCHVVSLAGANALWMSDIADGLVSRMHNLVLGHFDLVENSPELLGTAGYRR